MLLRGVLFLTSTHPRLTLDSPSTHPRLRVKTKKGCILAIAIVQSTTGFCQPFSLSRPFGTLSRRVFVVPTLRSLCGVIEIQPLRGYCIGCFRSLSRRWWRIRLIIKQKRIFMRGHRLFLSYSRRFESMIIVTGPSFSSSTCIIAPNSPLCTSRPETSARCLRNNS